MAQDRSVLELEVRTVLDKQVAEWNNGNIDRFMEGYANSDSLRFASNGTITYGWNNMLQRYKKNYSSKAMMGTLTFSGIDVDVLSEDDALVFGTWSLRRAKDEPWGLFTLLFRKINGEWRIVHDHTSSGD